MDRSTKTGKTNKSDKGDKSDKVVKPDKVEEEEFISAKPLKKPAPVKTEVVKPVTLTKPSTKGRTDTKEHKPHKTILKKPVPQRPTEGTKIEVKDITLNNFEWNKASMFNDTGDKEWRDAVTNFFWSFLDKYVFDPRVGDPEVIAATKKTGMFKEWLKTHITPIFSCFTHVSKDPVNNYDTSGLEKIGDKVLGTISLRYLIFIGKKLKLGFDSKNLTNYTGYYLSKAQLGKTVQALDLVSLARYAGRSTQSLQEDLMESLIGALYLIGEQFSVGYGSFLAERFIIHLLTDNDLLGLKFTPEEMLETVTDSKSWIKEIFDKFVKDSIEEYDKIITWNPEDNTAVFTLKGLLLDKINENNERILGNSFIPFLPGDLIRVHGPKSEALPRVASEARKLLSSFGLDDAWVDSMSVSKFVEQIDLNDTDTNKMILKMKANGYTNLKIEKADDSIIPEDADFTVLRIKATVKTEDNRRIAKMIKFKEYPEDNRENRKNILLEWIYGTD